jgi:2-oxoisovalerate dehydrogenase E1 component
MQFERNNLSNEELLHLYQSILKPRMIEEKMLNLLRQGRVSKWFSGIGQEAIAVGSTLALHEDEYIFPMHRNLGVFTCRQLPLGKLIAQWQGKKEGYSKGRERSFHFGTNEHHVVGMISHLGPQMALADGVALAHKIKGEKKISLVYTGDGGSSEGDFHEALNVAAVWKLPVIFLVENNGYGLSTPSDEQFAFQQFIDKGIGYGMLAVQVDGNNLLEVYQTVKQLAEEMRENPHPILLECITFRMRGHEEASGTKYVPQELFDLWGKKDPLENYQKFLIEEGVLSQDMVEVYRKGISEEILSAIDYAFGLPEVAPNTEEELQDVYAPADFSLVSPGANTKTIRFCDAITDGLDQAMEKHSNLVLMGQDIAEYGGVFKITQGFVEKFGKDRVRNTPLCESAILGAALGLSIKKHKAMVEMQFADFVTSGFNQIVNNLAKMHYRWGQNADVVVRMPTGAGVGAGPFHSQSNEAWFFHTPGLKVVYPSTPADAKGLLISAFDDPNPVMFFEHKMLYRSIEGDVPEGYYHVPIGKARVVAEGSDVTVVTYGAPVIWMQELIRSGAFSGEVELIDLRSLMPWDKETVMESVRKTGKVLVLTEDSLTGSIASEIAAEIGETCFKNLDAPVARLGALDTPIPFAISLEENFLPKKKLISAVENLLSF